MNNKTNKKLLIILLAIILAGAMFFAYNKYLKADVNPGEKSVSILVVNDKLDINEEFKFKTSEDYLLDLMEEHAEELKLEVDDSGFGPMIVGLLGYKADDKQNEFYHIAINSEDATVGAKDIVLTDGDVYKLELMEY